MIRKPVILLTAAVLVLLAVYSVWHFSPLRHLTRSKSQPDETRAAAFQSRNRPIIITKKILPEREKKEQATELPKPLIVLKDLSPPKTPQPAEPQEKSLDQETGKKALVLQPDGSLVAQKSTPPEVKPDAPAQTIPDKPQAASLEPEPNHPYSIILSSCRLPQSARKVVSDYKKVGLAPYVVKVKFDEGDEWLRVLAGHYRTRQEALKVKKEQQLSAAIVKKTPYTSLIGTFATREAMQETLDRLKELGYSPYFLKTRNARYKLVVGAFITKEGAEHQRKELQSKGIENKIIKR